MFGGITHCMFVIVKKTPIEHRISKFLYPLMDPVFDIVARQNIISCKIFVSDIRYVYVK